MASTAPALSDEEQELWDEMKLGSVDDEIRLCRIQLRRAMKLTGFVHGPPVPPGATHETTKVLFRRKS
jgi:hypothetical protein